MPSSDFMNPLYVVEDGQGEDASANRLSVASTKLSAEALPATLAMGSSFFDVPHSVASASDGSRVAIPLSLLESALTLLRDTLADPESMVSIIENRIDLAHVQCGC